MAWSKGIWPGRSDGAYRWRHERSAGTAGGRNTGRTALMRAPGYPVAGRNAGIWMLTGGYGGGRSAICGVRGRADGGAAAARRARRLAAFGGVPRGS